MNVDPRNPHGPGDDDLFDLPSDTPSLDGASRSPSPDAHIEKPPSALPRRAPAQGPAGPPLTSVEARSAGTREANRARLQVAGTAAAVAPEPASAGTFPLKHLWIAFGLLALVNGVVLGFVVANGGGTSAASHSESTTRENEPILERAAEPSGPTDATNRTPEVAVHEDRIEQPRVLESVTADSTTTAAPRTQFDASVLDRARTSLRTAREEIAAGSRGSARARIARVGLAIDAIQPSEREAIRADVALLLAQCIQAEADEAARAR